MDGAGVDHTAAVNLVQRSLAGDRAALSRLDIALDWAVARGDYALVDSYLKPLAEAAGNEVPNALELLIGLLDNHGIVRRTVAKHVRDEHLLDEACQDALVAIARHVGKFEGRSRFTTWVHPIAANAGRMATRASGRRREDLMGSQLPNLDPGLRRMSSVIVSRDQIRRLVDDLPDHYRAPFELREYQGHSYEEIAARLEISVGTVKSRISRAREELARRLGM